VVDAGANPVGVTGRQSVTAPPVRLAIRGGMWVDVAAWAGPWPVEERWWDQAANHRKARFQILTATGAAYLLVLDKGVWTVEAVYD
jgi:protein ImuB